MNPVRRRGAQAVLAAFVAFAVVLAACEREPVAPAPAKGTPAQPAFEPRVLELLQRVDPLPEGAAREPVLAVRGVPIRRGDFDRIVDYWLRTLAPDHARKTLRELALENELLPRALALSALPDGDWEQIAQTLEAQRKEGGRFDLRALTAALAPFSASPGNSDEVFELMIDRMRNAMPFVAEAGERLVRPGDQVGPLVTRDGVFVYERTTSAGLADPAAPRENALEPARWVRVAALIWRLRAADTEAGTYLQGQAAKRHLDHLCNAVLRGGEIAVLDPAFAESIPH